MEAVSSDPAALEAYFHQLIPITRAMGVRVESCAAGELILTAPLSLNHNHLGTAFGGSLSTLATLAGYGLLWLALEDPSAHVVVRESTVAYLHPVQGDLRAICRRADTPDWAAFWARLERRNKARINLQATIESEGREAVRFAGTFVAMRPPK